MHALAQSTHEQQLPAVSSTAAAAAAGTAGSGTGGGEDQPLVALSGQQKEWLQALQLIKDAAA